MPRNVEVPSLPQDAEVPSIPNETEIKVPDQKEKKTDDIDDPFTTLINI